MGRIKDRKNDGFGPPTCGSVVNRRRSKKKREWRGGERRSWKGVWNEERRNMFKQKLGRVEWGGEEMRKELRKE